MKNRRRRALAGAVIGALIVLTGAGPRHTHVASSNAACTDCHEQIATLSHPVDVYPSMQVPVHMPLEGGRLVCTTCHDVDAGEGPGLLRLAGNSHAGAMCAQCHDAARGGRAEAHALATSRAHLKTSPHRGLSGGRFAGLDRESENCVSCHDGTVASAGSVRTGPPGPMNALRLMGGQHPIGAVQRPRGIGDNLVSAEQLDPAVRLFDGRVGCGSCHSPYAGDEALLVMSNERSKLCLECHDF